MKSLKTTINGYKPMVKYSIKEMQCIIKFKTNAKC